MTRQRVPTRPGEVWVFSDRKLVLADHGRVWRVLWCRKDGELERHEVRQVDLSGDFMSVHKRKGKPTLYLQTFNAEVRVLGDTAVIRGSWLYNR